MKYRFHVNLTDQDYVDLNLFAMVYTPYGKNTSRVSKILVSVLNAAIMLIIGIQSRSVIAMIPNAILGVVFIGLWDRMNRFFVKGHIRLMKRSGKLPYSPSSVLEFYEDVLIEISEENKVEQTYSSIERIHVVNNRTMYLFIDNVRGFILPLACFKSTEEYTAFMEFIKTKCNNIFVH